MDNPAHWRVHALAHVLIAGFVALLPGMPVARAFDVTTHHYDALRTGWNNTETILTPGTVGSKAFGLIATVTLDEQVDAQPLVMLNQTIAGEPGAHTVVYVVTENNTVYAIDGASGAILKQRHLGTPVNPSTNGGCYLNSAVIGIGATPVIDAAAGILYLISDTTEGPDGGAPTFRLHALKLTDLSDAAVPGGVVIKPAHKLSNGSTYEFKPYVTHSRSALLLLNGKVYAGFASYCDYSVHQSRGWLLGWNASTLAPLPNEWLTDREATSPHDFFLTAIWMSGSGVASDGSSLYFVTGNSDDKGTSWETPGNLTESVVKLSPDLSTLESAFTPYTYPALDHDDFDFGSGGIMLLPPQPGSVPALATALGKDGNLFLMNRALLGGHHPHSNAVLGTYNGGGCWCAESFFIGKDGINRVVSSGGSQLQTWQVHTKPKPILVADAWQQTIETGQDGGFFTTVSSNGNTNGIIWAIGRPDGTHNNAVYLDAFDANSGDPLVTNLIAGSWPHTAANANLVPVVTGGRVYVGSFKQLSIFGLEQVGRADRQQPIVEAAKAPEPALPAGTHRLTGTVASVAASMIVLSTRNGATVDVDLANAIPSGHKARSGEALTAIGQYRADGTLLAQSVGRAKSNPALWVPDR